MDLQVALDLALTAEAPVVLDLLTGEVRLLGIQNLTTTFEHLYLTLSAAGFTTTSGGEEDTVLVQGGHQVVTLSYRDGTVAIDLNIHIARRRKIFLCHEQDDHQEDDHQEEYSYTICYKLCHFLYETFNIKH